MTIPDGIIEVFRATAIERLDRFERTWAELVGSGPSSELEIRAASDLHTVKGDAGFVGRPDVGLLCGHLEVLLKSAVRRRFAVPPEWSSTVTGSLSLLRSVILADVRAPDDRLAAELDALDALAKEDSI
jgi:chemotaxis protein histidine kinase CheA